METLLKLKYFSVLATMPLSEALIYKFLVKFLGGL